jgi:hypothetical protein
MGGSSLESDHPPNTCSAALLCLPGERPFPGALVSDKIRSGVGLTVADDQSAGRGVVPGAPGRAGGAWNDQDRMANAPVDERLAASGMLVVVIDRLAREAPIPRLGGGRELWCPLAQIEGP